MNTKYDIVYKTRKTGRIGNESFEYAYWLLRCINDGKILICTYNKLWYPFNNAPMETLLLRRKNINFSKEHDPPYPFDVSDYLEYKEIIKEMIKFEEDPLKTDLVIHVRLDDIDTAAPEYFKLSDEYYLKILNNEHFKEIISEISSITIIGFSINHEQTERILKISELIKNNFENTVKINTFYKNDPDTDLRILGSSKYLIASTSTFWFWPVFISNNIRKIFYPDIEGSLSQKMNLKSWNITVPI